MSDASPLKNAAHAAELLRNAARALQLVGPEARIVIAQEVESWSPPDQTALGGLLHFLSTLPRQEVQTPGAKR